MKTRSAQLLGTHRRVLAWSLGIAVVLHLALFFLTPQFDVKPLPGSEAQRQAENGGASVLMFVDVLFGPPAIYTGDGTLSSEPPDRVLEAQRMLPLPTECASLDYDWRTPARARVRLRVRASGRATVVELTESTGDPCGDEVITKMADALRYRWLPDERFPAPVDLIQPVTIVQARD